MICMKCRAISPGDACFCNRCGASAGASNVIQSTKKLNIRHEWGKLGSTGQQAGTAVESAAKNRAEKEPEHLFPWLAGNFRKAIHAIPHHIVSLAIYAGIVLFTNLIFWTANLYKMPAWLLPVKGFISLVVFLTATYNDIIPKTIFWVLLFTFGKKLLLSMRKKGFGASFACLKNTIPEFAAATKRLGNGVWPILLSGAGIGLIIANNFASYSRFSGARNKLDKYFIVLIMAFTISYLLGEAKKSGIFKFVKLGTKDISMLFGKPAGLSDDGVYVLLSGFVAGLILDAPLILAKWNYGGYIMGVAAIIAGIVLIFMAKKRAR